jgi:hypothetical protein
MKKTKLFTLLIAVLLITNTTTAQTGNETQGTGSGVNITSGDYNTLYGDSSGASITGAKNTTLIGYNSGRSITTSSSSDATFIGYQSGFSNTSGFDNTFIGAFSGFSNTTAGDNTFIGVEAGYFNTTGTDNTFIGEEAGYNNTTGNDNTFIGEDAGYDNTTGKDNTFIGSQVGHSNTTGEGNTFVGSDYTFLGSLPEFSNGNFAEGYASTGWDNTTGQGNTFLGGAAGGDNGVGNGNTFLGYSAGGNNEHADYNTFVGFGAGSDNNRTNSTTDANHNTYLGYLTGGRNREGQHNVGIGSLADFGNFGGSSTDISRTTFIGAGSFVQNNDAIAIGYNTSVTGFKAITLGNNATANSSYSVAIGADAVVTTPNSMVLGGNTPTDRVSVGIGTSAPNQNASLELADTTKGLLINRLTTALRTTLGSSLTATDEGLMVYDTDLNETQLWDGAAWISGSGTPSIEYNTNFALNGTSDSLVVQDAGTRFAVELTSLQDGIGTDAQDLTLTTHTLSLTNDASTVDLSGYLDNTDAQTLSLSGTDITIAGGNTLDVSSLQDGTGTDDQAVDAFSLTGTTLNLSLESDGVANNTVDLSSLQDGTGTDAQDLTLTTNTLSLTNDASTVDLSGYLDNTDDQTLSLSGTDITIAGGNTLDVSSLQDGIGTDAQDLTLTTNTLSLTNDASTVDLSGYLDNTDAQTLSLSGTDITIAGGNTLDVSSLQDGTGTDAQDLTLTTNTLSLTNDASTVDLSGYLDNTDAQTLSLSGTDITIAGGNTLDVSSLQDGTGTDDQNISGSGLSGTNLTIGIEGGSSEIVDLSSLQDGVNDADADPTNEYNTTVILNGTNLETTDAGGTITTDLSSLVSGGTDDQNMSGSGLSGTNLTLAIENGSSEVIDLAPLLVGLQNMINALTLRVDSLEFAVNTCCGTSLKVDNFNIGNEPVLGQNYPNPFNENTTIEYYLPSTIQTSYMDIVAINGALIKTIQINSRGDGHIILETGDMAPGNYFYRMYADGQLIGTKQMIVAN